MNLAPANYGGFDASNYSSNVGQSLGHGQGGTVCNGTAAEGNYVKTVGKLEPSIQSGGDGYGFTGDFPGKIIGPDAGYLGLDKYNNSSTAYARPGNIINTFKGGKRSVHKFRQIGCKKSHKRSSHRHKRSSHKRISHKRSSHKRISHKRSSHRHKHKSSHRHKRSSHRKGSKSHTRRHGKTHRRRYHGGTFGQTFNTALSAQDSAFANPLPMSVYDRCAIVPRS